jgi:hypothetical protein
MDPVAVLAQLEVEDKRLTALALDTDMSLEVLNHLTSLILEKREYADVLKQLVFALETKDLGTIAQAEQLLLQWSNDHKDYNF